MTPAATPMTPERWREVQRVFHAALERPAAERGAALDALCGGDPALRAEVEALLDEDALAEGALAADASGTGILDGAAAEGALGALAVQLLGGAADAEPLAGRRVGPYTVLRLIGRGGMGAVYLAERADVGLSAALKVVAGGLAAPERVARFLVERRVLARLEHPNVARLLDAGVDDDGTPWFAMEYVRGEPIDEYCDRRRLGVAERLALAERVCDAVAYAHRNLVVHRDLKPANILVGDDGAPKLLDFGIAKLLEDGADGLTGTGMRLLTPEYAAPEQLTGAPVTVAADVYALGVILYELLTGRRPYRVTGRSAGEIERAVLGAEPLRPSAAVTRPEERRAADGRVETVPPELAAQARATGPAQLGRRLAGDLDAIVLRALAKEPERRYASVEALRDDLRHHRLGLPVRAQPDTGRYRAGKFVRRHRPAVAGAALLVALLAGFAGAMAVQQSATARERDRAEAALARAQREAATSAAATAFLTGLFAASDPYEAGGDTLTVRQVLERGAARLDRLDGQPEVQARMLGVIGRVYQGLGQEDRALALHRRALARWQALRRPPDADIAATLHDLGRTLNNVGHADSAAAALERAVAMRRRLHGDQHEDVAKSLVGLGTVLLRRGDVDAAERRYREALAIFRSLPAPDRGAVAGLLNNLAVTAYGRGRYAEAEASFRELIAARRAQLGPRHPLVGEALSNLGNVLLEQRRYADAEAALRESLAVERAALGAGHRAVARPLGILGRVLTARGQFAGADSCLREALAIKRAAEGPRNPSVGETLLALGALRARQGDARAADALYGEALALFRAGLPPAHALVGEALRARAALHLAEGRAGAAERDAGEARAILARARGEGHPTTADAARLLAEARGARARS
jgi:serine/threonine-protein kinase